MIQSVEFSQFKNFQEAMLPLGPLTVIVGTNAAGKSNIRDGFRFLHGLSRGYSLAEVIGEKWIEGGVLQWRGIRGGTREVTFQGSPEFGIRVCFRFEHQRASHEGQYEIRVRVDDNGTPPRVVYEELKVSGVGPYVFSNRPPEDVPPDVDARHVFVRVYQKKRGTNPALPFLNQQPVLTQMTDNDSVQPGVRELCRATIQALSSMRFLDLAPDAMKMPSIPGQTILGDRGENLSSVLQALCADASTKSALLAWVRELSPMDAADFDFVPDAQGKVLLHLVEGNGRRTSAVSASDGTLRFLAMIAALLGPEPSRLYFFEELENGIHPTRLGLLLQLVEQQVRGGAIQVVATTHSPLLLGMLTGEALESASLVYRLRGELDGRIRRILDLPDADRLIERQSLARLQASGWLEDVVAFLEPESAP